MKASFLQSAVVCCCMRERERGTSNKRSTKVAIARYREREFKETCPSLFCTYSRNSTLFNFVLCKSIGAWGLSDLHSAKKLSMHQLENIHLKTTTTTTTTTLNEDFKKKTEKQRENYIYVHMLLMVELLSKSRDAHSSIPSANFNLSAGTVRATDCITISSRKSSAKFTKQKNYYLKPPSKNPIQLCLSLSLSPQHREKPRFPTWFKLSRTKKKNRATLLLNREPKRSSSKNSWSCQNSEKTISKWRLKTRTTQLSQAHHPSRWIFAWNFARISLPLQNSLKFLLFRVSKHTSTPTHKHKNLCLLIISLHSPSSSSAENSRHPPECWRKHCFGILCDTLACVCCAHHHTWLKMKKTNCHWFFCNTPPIQLNSK